MTTTLTQENRPGSLSRELLAQPSISGSSWSNAGSLYLSLGNPRTGHVSLILTGWQASNNMHSMSVFTLMYFSCLNNSPPSIIISAKGGLTSSPRSLTNPLVLASFSHLSFVSVDYHNDFLRSSERFPYYQLVRKLPASVETLEILNAHAPDEHIIKLVSQYCPDLTELRLGRCTMFSDRDCVWWKAHPGDHDAYMADRGIEAYAVSGNLWRHTSC